MSVINSGEGYFIGAADGRMRNPIQNTKQCHIQRLPAELRNEIFHLALVEEGAVEVSQRWPGLFGTCKQYRDEALAIYFGSNSFVARVIDLDDVPVITWLKKLEGVEARYKRTIAKVTIVTEGQLVDVGPAICARPSVGSCRPNYDFWENITYEIKAAGLTCEQLTWPSSLLAGIQANTWHDHTPLHIPHQLTLESVLLYNEILPLLLKRYELYDERTPPPDVEHHLSVIYGQRVAAWMGIHRMRSGSCRPMRGAVSPRDMTSEQATNALRGRMQSIPAYGEALEKRQKAQPSKLLEMRRRHKAAAEFGR